jgi:uncharacterized protein (TIGR02145 family)
MPVYPDPDSTIALPDVRNGQQYTIRKLQDNKCWMITNLKLGEIGSSMLLDSTDTDLPAGTTFTLPSVDTPSLPSSDPDHPGYGTYVYGPVTGDSSGAAGTQTSNDAKDSDTFYGYLYRWPVATAHTGNYLPIDGGMAPGSICPAGWRLPTATTDPNDPDQFGMSYNHGDFAVLNASMAADERRPGDIASGSAFSAGWQPTGPFHGVFSGLWKLNRPSSWGGLGWGPANQGNSGMLWSSTDVGGSSAYFTLFDSGGSLSVSPSSYTIHDDALAVRCVIGS